MVHQFTPPTDFDIVALPPNASLFMRLLAAANKFPHELWVKAGQVGEIRLDVPAEAIPFLVYEYGLEPVMPYLGNDPSRALIEGRFWQRLRGTGGDESEPDTPAAVRMALGWVGYEGSHVEADGADSWWDLWQIDLSRVPDGAAFMSDLRRIIAVSRLSKEAHTDVVRIYSGHDVRMLRLNTGTMNNHTLNDWSGVWIEGQPDWPKLSFKTVSNELSDMALDIGGSDREVDRSVAVFNRAFGFIINHSIVNGGDRLNPLFATDRVVEIFRSEAEWIIALDAEDVSRLTNWAEAELVAVDDAVWTDRHKQTFVDPSIDRGSIPLGAGDYGFPVAVTTETSYLDDYLAAHSAAPITATLRADPGSSRVKTYLASGDAD